MFVLEDVACACSSLLRCCHRASSASRVVVSGCSVDSVEVKRQRKFQSLALAIGVEGLVADEPRVPSTAPGEHLRASHSAGHQEGIVEVADVIAVTKNDGPRKLLAQQTKAAYARAVMYTEAEQGFAKPVIAVSSEEGTNVPELWQAIWTMWQSRLEDGTIERLRRQQSAKHFLNYFEMELLAQAKRMSSAELETTGKRVLAKEMTPREAGDVLVHRCLHTALAPESEGVMG